MKVVCDSCGTRYSIDDSRIAGKAFKVRCRHCAHVVLVRGAGAPIAEPAVTTEQVPDAGTWYVLVEGTHRTISVAELHRQWAAGELDDSSLIWREGFDDWRELGTVDELRRGTPRAAKSPASPNAAWAVR